MIKFLYATDPHAKGVSPSTRTDDFPSTIEKKLLDFFAYGHEQNVDFFVMGGDFMDSPYASSRYVKRIGELFKKALDGKELFFVWGNHDMIAWNPNTIDDTSFGLLSTFVDNFTLLRPEPIRRTYNGIDIELSGVSSYARLDRHVTDEEGNIIEHRSRDYVIEETGVPRVHVVHGYLSPTSILEDIPHTVIEEMQHTKAAFTLTGHEHTGFAVLPTSGGLVYNPGALGRVFASHTEMNRMPKYALCEWDGKAHITPVESRVALRGEEVMDRSALDAKKLQTEMLAATKGSIKEVLANINIEKVDLREIVSRFKDDVKPTVYEETKRRLGL